ncbi:ABC transporter permease [Paenibacillus sp. NFR01]|uniref:ABC transporter permease n=1 Tax=Paenibacillus sp. NFR01 TaxID=1566279 RepID=UPI0008B9B75F|nr:ABC transporter permease [Paenibacillus sp. NFR01]SES98051.1 putative ABC transport system permease protein [Paenibacillus sp. NFR01]
MFLKILGKDLRRKKTMNTVLLVIIILASTLLASSTNLMYSTTTALGSFIKTSKVADFMISLPDNAENTRKIEAWAKRESRIGTVHSEEQLNLSIPQLHMPSGTRPLSSNLSLKAAMVPEQVNLVFNMQNKPFVLKEGEIALPVYIQSTTGLRAGDKLGIEIGGEVRTFTVKTFFKDAYLGADLVSLKRLLLTDSDFAALWAKASEEERAREWSFVADRPGHSGQLGAAYSEQDLPSTFSVDQSMVKMSYLTESITSAMLFVVSLFLIFIAFLTLRFTIVSTIQDDYREIGVLKAIGFRNAQIRNLYMAKYFFLSATGGLIGLGASLWLTGLLSRKISRLIIVPEGIASTLITIFSIIAVVALTLLFCQMCMRRVNRASAIDAIRLGETGERFKASRKIYFHRRGRMPAPLFLAVSDVLNRLKGYSTLILTFILSAMIIVIPVNLNNTVMSPQFMTYFGLPASDFYAETGGNSKPVKELLSQRDSLQTAFKTKGFDVDLAVTYMINTKYISPDGKDNMNIFGMKNEPAAEMRDYLRGSGPKLDNEIAITSIMSEHFGVGMGDNVTFEIGGVRKSYLVSGIFQTISNAGYMVRLPDSVQPEFAESYQFSGIIHPGQESKAELIGQMRTQFTDIKIKDAQETMSDVTGGFIDQLRLVIAVIVAVVSLIAFFITSLFVRLLIAKEVKGIAILKSLGFTNGNIRIWQSLRILILSAASVILGILAGNLLGARLAGMIFRVFGITKLNFVIDPVQVYVLCPLLIFAVVVLAVYSSSGQIRKIQVWNINEE